MKKVNVLGTAYMISSEKELEGIDGSSDWTTKTIQVCSKLAKPPTDETWQDLDRYRRAVIRHELIHAFLHESGIMQGSNQRMHNEEVVDWFANMIPKINKAFKEAGCED